MANCSGITKDGNVITVDYVAADGTRGASWTDPYRLVDILDTAVAGAWGNVSVQNGTDFDHYYVGYGITIQCADTYFLIQGEGLMIETTETFGLYVNGANFKSNIYAITYPNNIISTTRTGGNYVGFYNNITGEAIIEDTIFNRANTIYALGAVTLTRSYILSRENGYLSNGPGVTLEDIIISKGVLGMIPQNNFTSADRIKIQNCNIGILAGYGSFDMSNLQIVDCNYDLYLRSNGADRVCNLTDSQIDVTNIATIAFAGNNDVTLNLLSTFKINITNGDGATATLYDQNDNVIDTQVLSGEWSEIYTYYSRYYETSGGAEVEDTETEYYPFKLIVTKDGYQNLTIDGITITAGEVTNIFGYMIEATQIDADLDAEITTSTGLTGELTTSTGLQAEMN